MSLPSSLRFRWEGHSDVSFGAFLDDFPEDEEEVVLRSLVLRKDSVPTEHARRG